MLTAKENLRQTIIPGGKPDRFVNNYEGVYLMFHPQLAHSGGVRAKGLALVPRAVLQYQIALHNHSLFQVHRVAAITALMVCMRFSASSNTMDRGPSNTPSVTSMQSRPNCS